MAGGGLNFEKMIKLRKGTLNRLIFWIPIILIATPYIIFITPQLLGVDAYVVSSGSMEPKMPKGSAIYIQEVPPYQIEVGDVILFKPEPTRISAERVTHRVVEIREGNYTLQFKTKGDANPSPDPGWTPAYNVQGKRAFSIPHLGTIIETFRNPLILLAFLIIPSLILIRGELKKILDNLSNKRSRTPLAPKEQYTGSNTTTNTQ